MTWEDFLEHPSVTRFQLTDNAEKFLYFKTIHEILAGTTNYIGGMFILVGFVGKFEFTEGWQEILQHWENIDFRFPVSPEVKAWITKWNPVIQSWRGSLLHLQTLYHYSTPEETSTVDWQKLIDEIGDIVQGIERLSVEENSLTLSIDPSSKKIVQMIQSAGIERISSIFQFIRSKDYLQIWLYPIKDETEYSA